MTALCGRLFAIDPRSLAAFRFGIGLMLIADLIKRSLTLSEHYSDAGVLPRALALRLFSDRTPLPLYFLSGEPTAQAALFVLAGLVALALALSWWPRLAAALSLVFLISLQERNPLVNHAGDGYLLVLVFWCVLLPPAGRWAAVAWRERGPAQLSVGTAALLLQVGVFYLSAGLFKIQNHVWRSGEALGLFLQLDNYTRPLARLIATQHPGWLSLMTYATLAIECLAPLLLFSPLATARLRVIGCCVLTAFHLGLELSAHIGLFQLTGIAALAAFIPGAAWDRLAELRLWRRCAVPAKAAPAEPSTPRAERLRDAIAALCLGGMLLSNASSVLGRDAPLPDPLASLARRVHLIQKWSMFASIDKTTLGWFSVVGELEDGSRVDVFTKRPFDGVGRPEHHAASFVNHNQRRYWYLLARKQFRALRPYLAAHLCERWNASEPRRLVNIGIVRTVKQHGQAEPRRFIVVSQACER